MKNYDDLRAEIEALRREIAAVRAERQAAATKASELPEPEAAGEAPETSLADQLRTLAREISNFAEDTEKGVVSHPLTSVLGALVLGVLIGRVLPR
jgi:ElaB/YqjD/DUF883 family membrane-anchored ribosome-binding protein